MGPVYTELQDSGEDENTCPHISNGRDWSVEDFPKGYLSLSWASGTWRRQTGSQKRGVLVPSLPLCTGAVFLTFLESFMDSLKWEFSCLSAAPSWCPYNMWSQFASIIISSLRFSQRSCFVLCLQFQARCLVYSNFSVTSVGRVQWMNGPKCIPKPKILFCGTAGCVSWFYRQWGKMFPQSLTAGSTAQERFCRSRWVSLGARSWGWSQANRLL